MLVVSNSRAGTADRESVDKAVRVLRDAVGTVDLVGCQDRSELDTVLTRYSSRDLVVVGGDGSLHTMLSVLYRRDELGARRLGLIPLGTGNDFAQSAGIPLDPVEAARVVLTGRTQRTDLIVDDAGHVVVNAVHVGLGAEAAEAALPLKRRLGILAYPVGAVVTGLTRPGQRLRVRVDGRTVARGRRPLLMVGMSNATTIAGGTAILGPDASVTDGHMDVTVSAATGLWGRITYALRLRRGTHPDHPDVQHLRGRTVTISGRAFRTNADGELSDPVRRRTWRVLPGAWQFRVPAT